ncbi:MAG TPA: MlaD family protein [Candidatus Polarisedimenticolaceae bacterium]
MASKNRSRDVLVGGFTVLALVVFALAVMAVGGESRLFSKKASYRAVLQSSDGLVIGSPVKMSGVQVGTVTDVRLSQDPSSAGIEVTLGVQRAYQGRVREGSMAALRFLQYLSGEKYVEITPGDPGRAEIAEGSLIPTQEGSRFLETGEDIAENLNEITLALRRILEPLEEGKGLLGEMIQNPEFGKEGLQAARGALENLEALTARLRAGEGFAGRMLFDPSMEPRADDLGRAIHGVADAVERLEKGEGAAGDLLSEGGRSKQAVADLAEAAASLKRTAAQLESREGLLGRLLYDKEYGDAVAKDIRETVSRMNSIAGKIDSGQGTLGALVNERVLHDSMEEVVAGVGDSKFASWLIRHYQKQGIEAAVPEPGKP